MTYELPLTILCWIGIGYFGLSLSVILLNFIAATISSFAKKDKA